MKKILAITGIRSDYDLMSSLYKKLNADPAINLKLLVGGAHLSSKFGRTVDLINQDGLKILQTVESLLDSDSSASRIKSASIFLQGAIDCVSSWNPDLIIYAGDREETWIGAMLGNYLEIPTVHFYGGDHTSTGHLDNPVRHAVSKLSTVHAVTLELHRRRLVLMGEPEGRIHLIGNMSIDNFARTKLLTRSEMEKKMGLPKNLKNLALVIFHPDPSEVRIAAHIMDTILKKLKMHNFSACIGIPNTDFGNQNIIETIEKHCNDNSIYVYKSLARDEFISLYKYSKFIIGNSSSGIMEAASIPIPAINVGLRQAGRIAGPNVIFCNAKANDIENAINAASSTSFVKKIKKMVNPYGDGNSTQKAYELLTKKDFSIMRLKTEDPLKVNKMYKSKN